MEQDIDRQRIEQATGDGASSYETLLWGFKVIKKIISADELHKHEMAGLIGTMHQFGASQAMIQSIEGFDVHSVGMNELLAAESAERGLKRLLYAAILVAWSDGRYSPEERAAVMEVASYYKISASTVAAIEHVVNAERELASARLALLAD